LGQGIGWFVTQAANSSWERRSTDAVAELEGGVAGGDDHGGGTEGALGVVGVGRVGVVEVPERIPPLRALESLPH
jgi:hypothetical protein